MEKMTKREKVMLGVTISVGVVGAGVAGYFGYKYYKGQMDIRALQKTCTDNKEELIFFKVLNC